MPKQTTTDAVRSLIEREPKALATSAKERRASKRDRAEVERDLMRARFGTIDYTPIPPIELTEAARKHWDQALKGVPLAMRRAGIEDALLRYALSMTTLARANAEIEKTGLLARGRAHEAVKNPLLSIRATAMTQIREVRNELGLPAAYRAKGPRKS